jgi:hypothetical protein
MHTYIYNAREEAEMKFPCFFFFFCLLHATPSWKGLRGKGLYKREREHVCARKRGWKKESIKLQKKKEHVMYVNGGRVMATVNI